MPPKEARVSKPSHNGAKGRSSRTLVLSTLPMSCRGFSGTGTVWWRSNCSSFALAVESPSSSASREKCHAPAPGQGCGSSSPKSNSCSEHLLLSVCSHPVWWPSLLRDHQRKCQETHADSRHAAAPTFSKRMGSTCKVPPSLFAE